jgi:hypothetical protein
MIDDTNKTPSTEIDRVALQDLERDDLQSRFMRRVSRTLGVLALASAP